MCSDRPKALMRHRLGSLQSSRLPHLATLEPNRRALQSLVNSCSWNRVKQIHPFVLHETVNTAWKMKSGMQTHTCVQPAPSPLSHSPNKAHEIHFFFFLQLSVWEDVGKLYPLLLQWFSFSVPLEKRRCCLMTLTFGHSLFIRIQEFEPSACSFCPWEVRF